MKRSDGEFQEEILGLVGRVMWEKPHALTEFYLNHMSRAGAGVYALEHSVFADLFPRWFGNIVGSCPHLDARQYMIENMYVEEVRDPTIDAGHYESLVDFAVALGYDRDFVYSYKGAVYTQMATAYWDWASRTKPWLEAFAAVGGLEVGKSPEIAARYGMSRLVGRGRWTSLDLPGKALTHWEAADEADLPEGGHSDETVNILVRYADTEEKQNAVLESLEQSMQVHRFRSDLIGQDAIKASKGGG